MTARNPSEQNMFLDTPLGALFAKTAVPIIFVMLTNGLYTVVDGWFIGRFVGPDAFSAVTMVFPLYMMLIALGTLVSSGFSSVLARALGAGKWEFGEELLLSACRFICRRLRDPHGVVFPIRLRHCCHDCKWLAASCRYGI